VLTISIFAVLVRNKDLANMLLALTGVFLLVLIFAIAFKQKTVDYRNKTIALIILTLLSVVFWAVFFQMFFSVNLFTERNINRVILGHQIPTTAFISIESIFIILTGPFLARLWQNLSSRNKNPSTAMKFSFSYLFIAGGYFLLALGTHFSNAQGLISPLWIVICYFFVTLGEMLLSPIGLSAVTALSPPRLVGLMMGVWLIAIGFGGKLGGEIAKFSSIPENINNHILENSLYGQAFLKYALLSLLVSVVIALFAPKLKRLMGENTSTVSPQMDSEDQDPKVCDSVT
jgi:POT family proton-dependent oligopeptide transporter